MITVRFSKNLAREYNNQSEAMYYEPTGIDCAKEWIKLGKEEKRKSYSNHLNKLQICIIKNKK